MDPYVDLRHLVSGCGCEKTGCSKRYGRMLECWIWLKCGRKVEEMQKKQLLSYKMIRMVNLMANSVA
jgi:hypothetical protein